MKSESIRKINKQPVGSDKNSSPVRRGEKYRLSITGLGHSGEGVGRIQDFTIFVPEALPGETIEVMIEEVKKTYARGKISQIVDPSEARCQPPCAVYDQCGGCQLQHLNYPGQLAAKRQLVLDAVTRIGKLTDVTVHPTLGADSPWYYRNKMQSPVGLSAGEIAVGCFAQGTHDIIDSSSCHIQHHTNNLIAATVKQIILNFGISVYNERLHQGTIRHILGRVGTASGEVMVVLVTATRELPHANEIVSRLRQAIPGLVSVVHNVNDRQTNIILGDYTKTIWGKDTILDSLDGLSFRISAKSFFQVNTEQAAVLYRQAVKYACLSGRETVLDLYCGTGTIALFLARHCRKVIGIEIVAPAIADAKQNAELNGITNADFICGDAVDMLPKLVADGVQPDVVVIDPPRAGCERKVLEVIATLQPERVVYVSCNPASLARDLAILGENGYLTKEIQPVDMFPQTYHVECCVWLKRKHSP
ncbi:23S rRNA (uracil(1939)-C(5))-methyltransferase RlmD [Anaerosporomusa subterranea]|uniref:23S rRNA (uracil(1939)-C(5))-methyltransferase RlmD n=1 Tax=Anaerosporomusa subterranea TaxID=1794912 RepID=UPI0009EDD938|nr:23S rRNA (uracil(1939)-C(5))-methyltransferase RlmD [Anaerosporomusa subterranea]